VNERHDFVKRAHALRPDVMRRLIAVMPGESPIDLERHAANVVLTLHDLQNRNNASAHPAPGRGNT
jgi:hypothetical protein